MVLEGPEDSICRFYSGLRREIQDIVDYKEFNTVNQLFQFAMLAEKELQGCEQRDKTSARTSFAPRTSVPSQAPKVSNFRMPPPTDKRPAVSSVPTAANKPPSRATKSGKTSI